MTVNTLRDLLSAGGVTPSSLDFVFVSACHSRSVGQAFVDAGARHVVCVGVEAMIQVALTARNPLSNTASNTASNIASITSSYITITT